MGFVWVIIIIVIVGLALGVRIINQYERGVVFRLGRITGGVRQPGLRVIIPFIDQLRKVNLRTQTMPIQSQNIITRDNVSLDVSAVAYYKVDDAVKSLVEIENVAVAINQIAQTTVRNIVGQSQLDELLSETEKINTAIKGVLDKQTEQWGVQMSVVELKDIQLPPIMQQAMAAQAQAEREKRAKVIAAEGEYLSAAKLGDAADIIAAHPIALQLRNLQVLTEIASDKNSTIVFPAQFMDTMQSVKAFVDSETPKK
jgi:regulator of protease activity HflC (stomatin/prohibitin superfamily)